MRLEDAAGMRLEFLNESSRRTPEPMIPVICW
jgi:hypothetical protein